MSVVTTVYGIVARDFRRSLRQQSRLFGGLARSFMWLLLVGTGYNAIARVEGAASYQAFVYPGIVVMAALFGAMLTAISTVYDREFGMLRLMLSCPAGTMAVLTGRALSATLVGIVQGGAVLLCGPLLLDLTAGQIASAAAVLVVAAASSSLLGLLVAAPLRSVENFAAVINVVLFPLLFVSGALYPTAGMPIWLRGVARVNPVTYQVDLMRIALGQPGELPAGQSLITLLVSGLVVFAAAAWLFDPEHRFIRPARGT
ncbi:MAG: ABC transporter permease [Acidobacteriota bacterium]